MIKKKLIDFRMRYHFFICVWKIIFRDFSFDEEFGVERNKRTDFTARPMDR